MKGILRSIVILSLFLSGMRYGGFFVNTTSSMPKGLYRQVAGDITRGDLVLVCLPASWTAFARKRHYLTYGWKCHGSVPLLKRLVAIPGDTVRLTSDTLVVNHHSYVAPVFAKDRAGRPLGHPPLRLYRATSEYWLLGIKDLHSWDSRYFGGVARSAIMGRVKPVWVF